MTSVLSLASCPCISLKKVVVFFTMTVLPRSPSTSWYTGQIFLFLFCGSIIPFFFRFPARRSSVNRHSFPIAGDNRLMNVMLIMFLRFHVSPCKAWRYDDKVTDTDTSQSITSCVWVSVCVRVVHVSPLFAFSRHFFVTCFSLRGSGEFLSPRHSFVVASLSKTLMYFFLWLFLSPFPPVSVLQISISASPL